MTRWATLLAVPFLLFTSAGAGAGPLPAYGARSLDQGGPLHVKPLAPLTSPRLTVPPLVAQGAEPTPPGGVKSDEPGAKSGEPGAATSDEPGGAAGEPAAPTAAATPAPGEPPAATAPAVKKEITYGAGFQLRGIFVPFLGLFLDAYTDLASVALGGEFVRRKGNFDIVASINFGFYSAPDGNFVGNGENPEVDTDYMEFRDLNVLGFDVAFIWHHEFTPWLSLVYGAGFGLGIVLGELWRTSSVSGSSGGCTEDPSDLTKCSPSGGTSAFSDNPDAWLAKNLETCQLQGDGQDAPGQPCSFEEDDVWPVVPVLHLLIGVNFKINEQFSVRVDGGFHNAFYVGATSHYFF